MSAQQSSHSRKSSPLIKSLLVALVLGAGLSVEGNAAPEGAAGLVPVSQSGPGADADNIDPEVDNCPLAFNPYQEDANRDGVGDACDYDSDGIENGSDNCPLTSNQDQLDADRNGAGDVCDNGYDLDLDGILDSTETYLMETFAPLMYLYWSDYRPASADWVLQVDQAALLFDFGASYDFYPCDTDGFNGWASFRHPIGEGGNLLGIGALYERSRLNFCERSQESSSVDSLPGGHFMIDVEPSLYGGNLVSAPYYAHVSRGVTNRIFVIDYWFFYTYNGCGYDWTGTEHCEYTHEGDWEHIVIHVRRTPDDTYAPFHADYYFHGNEGSYSWDSLQRSGTRPYGYSALQTHASYPYGGKWDSCVARDDFGTCWWYRRDYTHQGVLWDPLNQVYTVMSSGESFPMDLPNGGVINVGERPLTRSRSYFDPTMGLPMPGAEWILFQGRWGKDGGDPPGPGTPSFQWYPRDPGRIHPPAVWKVADQSAFAGVSALFDIGYVYDDTSTPAVHVDWGDGGSSDLTLPEPGRDSVQLSHTYAVPGEYFVEVEAVDEARDEWGGNVFQVTVDEPPPAPKTGYAPGGVTRLPEQPDATAYTDLGDVWLEIPRLGVQAPIVGVALSEGTWDVSWLGYQVGWLEGTAFPTREGNSSLTAHVYDANGEPGPFVLLNRMTYGDEIVVHAWGKDYIYSVRSVEQVAAQQVAPVLQHEEHPWLTLITCRGYDETTNAYMYRVVVRAVQIEARSPD